MATTKTPLAPIEEGQVSSAEDTLKNPVEESAPVQSPETAPEKKAKAAPKKKTPDPEVTHDEEEEHTESQPAVDFSDEEAELAANAPEFDLGEEQTEQETESEKNNQVSQYDLTGKTKRQLADLLEALLEEKPVQNIRRDAEAIKIAFYKLHRADLDQQRKAFTEAGGNLEEFTPAADAAEQKLKNVFVDYRKKRDQYIANLERSKEENLTVKLKIIEDLKELVGSSETMNHTFNAFRELQQRWKETGPVPQANMKDLWETYNLHVENFYNFIKINKELRDLDLKKNYEAKIKLCEEAEALITEPSVVGAFHKLQKLHDEWRETGPVANEYKEVLWERFKEASSRVNKQHQDYFEGLKDEQKRNLDLKTELCVRTEELADNTYTSRKEWNKASEQLIEIQKIWKTIGFAPKKDNAKVYERFRNACDRFFENKRQYYLQLKTEMEHNRQLKNDICEAAEALSTSEDWKKATDELIAMQKQWKETGPVSRRYSDQIWKRFRAACDTFFERKSKHFSTVDTAYEDNLVKKRELLDQMAAFDIAEGGFEKIKEFQRRWSEIGFVPIKQKDAIQKEYKEIVDTMFNTLRGSERGRNMDRFKNKVSNMKNSGDRRLRHERDRLYNRVRQLESDIALLENNIGFFAKSKNAEAMINEVNNKIEKAKVEMAEAIEKINLIDKQQ